MSSRFVNPFTDLGFKIIFGQPASKDLLIIRVSGFSWLVSFLLSV